MNRDNDMLERLEAGGVRSVTVCLTDIAGQLIGKRCASPYFMSGFERGFGICDLMLAQDIEMKEVRGGADTGKATGYRDITMRPALETMVIPPWRPHSALVLADCVGPDGQEVRFSPRSVLKNQMERLRERGLAISAASELEFFIFEGDFSQATQHGEIPGRPLTRFDADGHVFQSARYDDLWVEVQQGLEAMAIPIDYIKFEGGRGQAEVVLQHAGILQMADRHVLYKQSLREIAARRGNCVTFMAKPFADQVGSSGHIHYSLCDAKRGRNLSSHESKAGPVGLSREAEAFLAGQIALVREMFFFLAPTVNAYKRFVPDMLAPVAATWGRQDRTAAFRIVGEADGRRVECRIPGADINPYLAYAALVAGGLFGLETGLRLKDVEDGARLPRNLREATRALDRSTALRSALGDDVVDHYVRYAAAESDRFDRAVTDWEIKRYMERI